MYSKFMMRGQKNIKLLLITLGVWTHRPLFIQIKWLSRDWSDCRYQTTSA